MKISAGVWHWLEAALLSFALAAPATALDPRLSLRQYVHTSWTKMEGKPLPAVSALAQTTDGYLWLGTDDGLLRFDGLRFSAQGPEGGY
jgi:ligand-binding sensor domain-containing protein